ncbi:hypothetical protein DASC09_058320 [Saccharomycopsis crataegensis]|uniref:GH16 domain-containing protein n=1 Tax=Saccharomycopsis crataegensis TaxID=43959 RepID=A0AAV5QU95_9ASCO|nr:hypothetical protein DASC09_058320 [Saccharomycopsis crataegensis]
MIFQQCLSALLAFSIASAYLDFGVGTTDLLYFELSKSTSPFSSLFTSNSSISPVLQEADVQLSINDVGSSSSASITSKFNILYGEATAIFQAAKGDTSTSFSIKGSNTEMTIEVSGNDPKKVVAILGGKTLASYNTNVDMTEDFHEYTIDFTPTEMYFAVDDTIITSVSSGESNYPNYDPASLNFVIIDQSGSATDDQVSGYLREFKVIDSSGGYCFTGDKGKPASIGTNTLCSYGSTTSTNTLKLNTYTASATMSPSSTKSTTIKVSTTTSHSSTSSSTKKTISTSASHSMSHSNKTSTTSQSHTITTDSQTNGTTSTSLTKSTITSTSGYENSTRTSLKNSTIISGTTYGNTSISKTSAKSTSTDYVEDDSTIIRTVTSCEHETCSKAEVTTVLSDYVALSTLSVHSTTHVKVTVTSYNSYPVTVVVTKTSSTESQDTSSSQSAEESSKTLEATDSTISGSSTVSLSVASVITKESSHTSTTDSTARVSSGHTTKSETDTKHSLAATESISASSSSSSAHINDTSIYIGAGMAPKYIGSTFTMVITFIISFFYMI